MQKFKFTDETMKLGDGTILHRIECVVAFKINNSNSRAIKVGDKGGFIEREANLEGNAWVFDDAMVYGNAKVYEDAIVYGNAKVSDNARVFGGAQVFDNAHVCENATIYDDAMIYGDAVVSGDCSILGLTEVYDNAMVYDYAVLDGNGVRITDEASVCGSARIFGNTRISGNASVSGNTMIDGNSKISGKTIIDIPEHSIDTIGFKDAILKSKKDFIVIVNVGKYNEIFVAYRNSNQDIILNTPTYQGKLVEYPLELAINSIDEVKHAYLLIKEKFNI